MKKIPVPPREHLLKLLAADSAENVAKTLGVSRATVDRWMKHYGIATSYTPRADIKGHRFGSLVAIAPTTKKDHSGSVIWTTRCDCGNDREVACVKLRSMEITSCRICSRGRGYASIRGRYWTAVQGGAKRRGIPFSIAIKDAWDLALQQKKKCALSGRDISFGKPMTASLDRIDSDGPYTLENVQWVHRDVNIMKNAFSQPYFIRLAQDVAKCSGLIIRAPKIINKAWGHEEVNWNGQYCSKRMVLKPGYMCSFHMHPVKDETFRVERGYMLLEYGPSPDPMEASIMVMREGNVFHVAPGDWHRFSNIGLDDCVFYETSTRDDPADNQRSIPSGPIKGFYHE